MKNKTIGIIIPIMNEEGNISAIVQRLDKVFTEKAMSIYDPYILFIDDGSSDNTLKAIKTIMENNKSVHYISFSRNFGHQYALKAGLDHVKTDCAICMDGDLQHPPELIPALVKEWENGHEIVNTERDDKKTGFFKRITSMMFYGLVNKLGEIKISQGSADFRLMDRAVVDALSNFNELPLFYRGLISWLGFKTVSIKYSPEQRSWGKTKYSLKKMFSFAINGITSFSTKPLRIATYIGLFISLMAFAFGIYALYTKFFTDNAIEGWTSLAILLSFLSGIQLFILGIIGEYLGKLFMAQKARPKYIIKEKKLG